MGCVPVLVSDDLIPPLHRTLNWPAFSVQIPRSGLKSLKAKLKAMVASGEYAKLFKNVLLAREALRYDNIDGAVGSTPLIVTEMQMVVDKLHGRNFPPS